jgi:hypothetical protein
LIRMVLSQSTTRSIRSNIATMRELRPMMSSKWHAARQFPHPEPGWEKIELFEVVLRAAEFCAGSSFARHVPDGIGTCSTAGRRDQTCAPSESERNGL